jgi:pimeloyl-ACP methyl ester carboxylesterase
MVPQIGKYLPFKLSLWVKLLATAVVVVLLLAYFAVSYLMASGITTAKRKPLESTPQAYGMAYEDVAFTSRAGDVGLRGWYIQSTGEASILFVHGINNNREEDGDFLKLAKLYSDHGYNCLLFDLRGHGESEGEMVSGGYFERSDVLGAFDYLVSRGNSPGLVAIHAYSMGAGTSLITLPLEPSIHAAVLDSPFANVSDMLVKETALKTPFPEWMVPVFLPGVTLTSRIAFGIDIGELAPEEAVTKIDYPILLVHGTADGRIPYEQSERIFENAPSGSELWLVPGVDHTNAYPEMPDEYSTKVLSYVGGRLSQNQ